MKKSMQKIAMLICTLALSLPAFAASLPDYYPKMFDRWGVIDQLDLENRIIVVNDVHLSIARDLRIYTVNTRFATAQSLKPGMKIGFGTTGSRAVRGPVTEVWVLPAGYTPPQGNSQPDHARRKGHD